MQGNFRQYSFSNKVYMLFCLLRTRLFYPGVKIIRFPFDIRNAKYIRLGKNLSVGRLCRLEVIEQGESSKEKRLIIGDSVRLGDFIHVSALEKVVIGDNVGIGPKSLITDINHGDFSEGHKYDIHTPYAKRTLSSKPVIIGKTSIVQAGQYGEYIGTIDIIFKNGKYAYPDYKLIRLDETIEEDKTILAKIDEMQSQVDKEFNIEIASLPYALTDENVRNKSTALGNFVSDIVASSQNSIDIALINSGSLRGQLPGGKVTLGNIYEFFPFDNLIILTTLSGKDLKNILELSASRKGEGAFLQISKDCIINFDSNGKLLESYIKGKPINDNEKYVVAVADYIFNGVEKYIDSNGKPLFQYGENIIHTGLDMRDLIIKTLKEYKSIPETSIDDTERIIFN